MNLLATYRTNTFYTLAFRLTIVLILISLSRILIYFFNPSLFPDPGRTELFRLWFYGLRFDTFSLIIFNVPFIILSGLPFRYKYHKFYRLSSDIVFYILNILILALNFIDIVFYRYQFKRMTWDIFDFISQDSETITRLMFDFIRDFFGIFLLWVTFSVALVFICSRLKADPERFRSYSLRNILIDSLVFLLLAALTVLGGRGGFQDKPISILSAGIYTTQVYAPVILNTPYTMIKTKNERHIIPKVFFSDEEAQKIFNPVKYYYDPARAKSVEKPNIVIIILEGFSAEHSAFMSPELENGHYKGYTPFLDSLLSKSLVYKAIANGKYSLDAMPAILAGLPGLIGSPYLTSPYVFNELNSLPILLKEQGYNSAFFHGGTNGTLSLDGFASIAGFDRYYGRSEFGNDAFFDGGWGIFDEEFLQYSARVIDEMKRPFLSVIFTLSSHHPYLIPERYKEKFPECPLEIQRAVMYTDYSLKEFFETVSKMEWYDNTLFILVADHTSISIHPFYNNIAGQYMIPLAFYQPSMDGNGLKTGLAQQADILPTIVDYLNLDRKIIAFGNSLLDSTATHFGIVRTNHTYQFFKDDYLLIFADDHAVSLFDIKMDSLLIHDLIEQRQDTVKKMENLLKSIIQQHDDRLIHNRLVVNPPQ